MMPTVVWRNCKSYSCGGLFSVKKSSDIVYSFQTTSISASLPSNSYTDNFKFHLSSFCSAAPTMRVSVYLLSITLTCALAASVRLEDTMDALVKEMRDIKDENNDLKIKVSDLELKEKRRESEVVVLKSQMSSLLRQQILMTEESSQSNVQTANLPYFTFAAYVTTNKYYGDAFLTPEVITFEALTQNVGDGFDLAGNRFRCPIDGYYEFFGILQISGNNCGSYTCGGTFSVHKGAQTLYSETFTESLLSSPRLTFKFHLNPFCLAGEEVWITFTRNSTRGWNVHGNAHPNSYFSGHLLREG